MSNWPATAKIILPGYGEEPQPSIRRTEMERGMPKQSLMNTHVMQELTFTVQFETEEAAQEFEDWYFNDLRRIGFFNFRNPRTRQVVSARFKEAKIGSLSPITGGFGLTQRTVTVEYLR
ncbi:hypothetical protein CPT_Silvanus_015 [Stenotrophomonas phage Silvanus]|nr:hypothetical protein CPT_Silvanus_015 [Stenotrophomonas phage Silvanus]